MTASDEAIKTLLDLLENERDHLTPQELTELTSDYHKPAPIREEAYA